MSWIVEVVGIVYVSTLCVCVCVDFMYKWIIVYSWLVFEEEFTMLKSKLEWVYH